MLESLSAAHSTFITLTYRDEDLPDPPNIKKEHAVAWQKQFRIKLARQYSLKCRFYTIGEYGGKKGRPHYHAIIFGPSHLISEEISLKAWPYGFIKASPMLPTHAAYVARYTTKKLQKSKATSYGAPEFAIMSRKPAIGSAYTETIAAELKNRLTSGTLTVSELQESLYRVAIQGKTYPLSKIMRTKIFAHLKMKERPSITRAILQNWRIKAEARSGLDYLAIEQEQSARKAISIVKNYREYLPDG